MKKLLIAALLISTQSVFAQITFSTGNADLDKHLLNLNNKAKEDINKFKEEVKKAYNMPIEKIEELLDLMEPAEVILTNDIAEIAKKPVDKVVQTYQANKDKGWGDIAKEMGIKPGSPEFHALKEKLKNKDNKGKAKGKSKRKSKGKSNGNRKGKK